MKIFSIILLYSLWLIIPAQVFAGDAKDLLMGAVVKSDRWTVNRKNNTENFRGNVSFKNPDYSLKADEAIYFHNNKTWKLYNRVYAQKKLDKGSSVELWCGRASFKEMQETAELWRSTQPIMMKYKSENGVIDGFTDKINADNKDRKMVFVGNLYLTTENINIFSSQGTYFHDTDNFLLHDTNPSTGGMPMTAGKREGYNFALKAETMDFYKETRDLKCKKNVIGWVKDIPYLEDFAPSRSIK